MHVYVFHLVIFLCFSKIICHFVFKLPNFVFSFECVFILPTVTFSFSFHLVFYCLTLLFHYICLYSVLFFSMSFFPLICLVLLILSFSLCTKLRFCLYFLSYAYNRLLPKQWIRIARVLLLYHKTVFGFPFHHCLQFISRWTHVYFEPLMVLVTHDFVSF